MKIKILLTIALSTILISCGGNKKSSSRKLEVPSAVLTTESDSLAYMIGVSMAQNLMKMDSLIDMDVVATAISQYGKGKSIFTAENAKATYMKYRLHIEPERIRRHEDQYLRELAARDRSYTRTNSGIIYNISELGIVGYSPRNNGDWVKVHYTISRMDSGEKLFSTRDNNKPLGAGLAQLPDGLKECVKLLNNEGKMSALIPSILAYGSEGDEALGIKPFETLRYDIELIALERNAANKHAKSQDPATF